MTDPAPYLRGVAWAGTDRVAYPRADPADARRLPADTWAAAGVPAGVRLEIIGSATTVEVGYRATSAGDGYRQATTWSVWRDDRLVDQQAARPGDATVRLALGDGDGPAVVHLPETMGPRVTSLQALDGTIEPAPTGPRWLAYGDSITEGWACSSPGRAWVAVASREHHLDAVNLGYAGAARGELQTAEQMCGVRADVISVSFGTNCWSMVPFTGAMAHATTEAFLRILRSSHPDIPIVVVSPVVRPDAEDRPNRAGATLGGIRAAIEGAVVDTAATHGAVLVAGLDILGPADLADGIHPDDEGHRRIAEVVGGTIKAALGTEVKAR